MELFSRYAILTSRRGMDLPNATSAKFYSSAQNYNPESEIPPIVGQ